MYANQFHYDMAEEHVDPLHDAEEHVEEKLDSGDKATAEAFAEYAYDRISHDELVAAMAALFRVTDSKWRTLRDKLCEDLVAGPLNSLRIAMDQHRSDFIAERAGQVLEGQ